MTKFRIYFFQMSLLVAAIGISAFPHAVRAQDDAEQMINDYIEQAQDVPPPDISQIVPLIPQANGQPTGNPTDNVSVAPAPAAGAQALPAGAPAPIIPGSDTPVIANDVPAATTMPDVVPLDAAPPTPPAANLAAPVVAPAPAAATQSLVPPVPKAPDPDENLFFDAESYVPPSQMSSEGTGVKKVSPRLEPASRFVVVKKDFDSGSKQATLTSADRALKLGRYQSALELYDQAYDKNPKDPNVLMGRALSLQHLDRATEAVQAYEEILDNNPDNVVASVNMLGLIGKQYPAVAARRLMELKKSNPRNASVYAQLAVVQANTGQYSQALNELGVAAGIEPTNASHVFNMGVIADRAGEKEAAVKYYEQALELDAVYGGSRSVPRDAIFERLSQLR